MVKNWTDRCCLSFVVVDLVPRGSAEDRHLFLSHSAESLHGALGLLGLLLLVVPPPLVPAGHPNSAKSHLRLCADHADHLFITCMWAEGPAYGSKIVLDSNLVLVSTSR